MNLDDPFDLERFRTAQQSVFATALAELEAGRKQTHWMWFIFPQLRGLGHSSTAQHYGIASLAEARAYLADPVLEERLREATETVLAVDSQSARELFGSPDDLKFRSSMTLFSLAAPANARSPFHDALERYFEGVPDRSTLALLES